MRRRGGGGGAGGCPWWGGGGGGTLSLLSKGGIGSFVSPANDPQAKCDDDSKPDMRFVLGAHSSE